jgi:hypothetical protein
MDLNSPLFDRVRIRSKAEGDAPRFAGQCQHPGCQQKGEHKAPLGRDREGQYVFFCLPHVTEYNKSYNYFQGMGDEAITAFQKDALTGHRPTWKIGVDGQAGQATGGHYDPNSLFNGRVGKKPSPEDERKARYGKLALKALNTLHLDENATKETIRAKYKSWVKQLHPDANGGDRSREQKLAEIIKAYNTLKASGHA